MGKYKSGKENQSAIDKQLILLRNEENKIELFTKEDIEVAQILTHIPLDIFIQAGMVSKNDLRQN